MFTSELVTKSISSYQIPDRYRAEAEKLLLKAIALFGEGDLLLFAITGSCALEFCVDGWSDINALIVTKQLDQDKNKLFYRVCSDHTIHIAPTLLTQKEFEKNHLNDASRIAVWQLCERMVQPNYVHGVMNIPSITLKDIQINDEFAMPNKVQIMKELLWRNAQDNKNEIIKTLYAIIKMNLRKRNCITYSYGGAFKKFAELYGGPEFSIFFELVSGSNTPSEQLISYAESVVKRICE